MMYGYNIYIFEYLFYCKFWYFKILFSYFYRREMIKAPTIIVMTISGAIVHSLVYILFISSWY
jgi:hypothetical protein